MPIGPLPQQVTNDLKSLDEMVSEFHIYFSYSDLAFSSNFFKVQFLYKTPKSHTPGAMLEITIYGCQYITLALFEFRFYGF